MLRKPVGEKKKIISWNIRAIDMHDFRTDVHNLLGSATQSNSTDPLGVYNPSLRQLLDCHAPLVMCTVTDHTPAPWMTLEIKDSNRLKYSDVYPNNSVSLVWLYTGRFMSDSAIWCQTWLLRLRKIILAIRLWTVVVLGNTSASVVRWWANLEILCFPQTFPLSIFLPDEFNEFFVHKIEEIRSGFDPCRPIPTKLLTLLNSLAQSLQSFSV